MNEIQNVMFQISKINVKVDSRQFKKAVNELSKLLTPDHFKMDSNVFDKQLIVQMFNTFFPLIKLPNVKSVLYGFFAHWLSVFEILEPELMIDLLLEINEEFLMPSFSTLSNLVPKLTKCKDERINWLLRILNKSDESDLKYLNINAWQFISKYGDEDLILRYVKLFLTLKGMDNIILILVKGKNNLIKYILHNASYEFLYNNINKITDHYDIINLAARISDDLFINGFTDDIIFKVLHLILLKDLTFEEKASLKPMVFFVNEIFRKEEKKCYFDCLVSFSNIGLFDLSELITYVKFDKNSSDNYLMIMFIISSNLIEHEEIQNIIFSLINLIIKRNNISLHCCLIDNMSLILPKLLKINKEKTYNIVNKIFNPIPNNATLAFYSLKFLNSLDDIYEYNFNIDLNEIIHKYLWLNKSYMI